MHTGFRLDALICEPASGVVRIARGALGPSAPALLRKVEIHPAENHLQHQAGQATAGPPAREPDARRLSARTELGDLLQHRESPVG